MIIRLSGYLGGHLSTTGNTRRRWPVTCALWILNPNDADLLADMGNLLIYVRSAETSHRPSEEGAIRLNPLHATWYVYYLGWAYEEAGMPKEAIEIFEKAIDLQNPDEEQLWYFPTVAAAYADPTVGRMDDARKIVKTFLSCKPEFSTSKAVSRYPYKTKELLDRLRECGAPSRTARVRQDGLVEQDGCSVPTCPSTKAT